MPPRRKQDHQGTIMSALPQSARPPLYKALADYKSALIAVGCFT
ncbi:hypothetical protein ALP71_04245, partial [Pseudomonas coronafaciens pv. garcae]